MNLIDLWGLSPQDIGLLLDFSRRMKWFRIEGVRKIPLLEGKKLVMIFEKPSTRTRASLAVAAEELGAVAHVYGRNELQLGRGESIEDTVRTLERYYDAIIARVYSHETLVKMAEAARIPVINALSDKCHPLQALADLMTIEEKLGKLRGVKLAFIGDGTDNVLNSLLVAGSKVGLNITVASPPQYAPSPDFVEKVRKIGKDTGFQLKIVEDPEEAVMGAEVIYTDVFVSMGQEHEREKRLKTFLPKYRVTVDLMRKAENAIFMHCLPAHRGEEVEDEVIDGAWSVVFDQAENRLHTSKAVLVLTLLGREALE